MLALSLDARDFTSAAVTVRVPAKVNLHLGVGRKRSDGFHELVTVYQALGLYDAVTVEPADELSLTVIGEDAGQVPLGDENLAVRAVRAVAALAGKTPDVAITVDKGIPIAGGMGGGSADAAAALVAADLVLRAGLDRSALSRLAAGLGSDVPFILHGGTALGTGRGEIISPVLGRGEYHWVLAIAEHGLSTPSVYAEFDRLQSESADDESSADGVLAALRQGDTVALGKSLSNDLQPAALRLRPALAEVLDTGRELGAVGGIVSGSGPTVALLARDSSEAVRIASALAASGVCHTVRQARGPVPGAKVV